MKTIDDPFGKIQAKGELQTMNQHKRELSKNYSEKQIDRKRRGRKNPLALIQRLNFETEEIPHVSK